MSLLWKKPSEDTMTDPQTGLTNREADRRLSINGPNKLVEEGEIRFISILREEITEPLILLLLVIGLLYGVINRGDPTDSLTIIAVVSILVMVEVWNEYRAKKSIKSLKKLSSPTTSVLRDGHPSQVPTQEIVVGDIILLKQGERVPADARLIDTMGLQIDESALTGESFPVAKYSETPVINEARSTEKQNMVLAGTVVTKGRTKAVVTATGAETELGRVAGITKAAREPKTPLQLNMKQLSKTLIWIALFFSILIPILSFFRGLPPEDAILYGLSLSFATVPEEMPIIITMILGVGAYSLSKKKAVVKRLRAAETLGNTTVIASDKTGTITEGKMRVESLYFDGKIIQRSIFGQNEKEAMKSSLLASDAIENSSLKAEFINPMAQAILEELRFNDIDPKKLTDTWVLTDELSFDSQRKLASYIYQLGNGFVLFSSGAPENVLQNSEKILLQGEEREITQETRTHVLTSIQNLANTGQRLLAFGYRRITLEQRFEKKNLEQNLIFVGFIGFIDPPRREVREAIEICKEAGIKVYMVTGDHPETAKFVAAQVGIPNAKVLRGNEIANMEEQELKEALKSTFVFARTSPEDKLRLVRILRQNGEVVAVTGDGINDAPALKEAHIGIAMGVRGTDVAKETADMILADDNFATITSAVREGRKIFSNLRKGVSYYLACKIALISSFLLPIALGIPLPFAPIQIIVLELFMDLAASATFVAEPQEEGTMKKPPINPKQKFMNRALIVTITLGALSLFAAVSCSYLLAYVSTDSLEFAQTMAFATWMIGHIFLALNFRSEQEPLVNVGLFSNKLMLVWALIAGLTLVAATNLPFLNEALKTTTLSITEWAVVLTISFGATFWMELKKMLKKHKLSTQKDRRIF